MLGLLARGLSRRHIVRYGAMGQNFLRPSFDEERERELVSFIGREELEELRIIVCISKLSLKSSRISEGHGFTYSSNLETLRKSWVGMIQAPRYFELDS